MYTEVLGNEYSNAYLAGQVHQITVDTYAVQHAGGPHPDKSLDIHLYGLYLALEKGIRPPLLQRLATEIKVWPHYEPPNKRVALTVFDVAFCDSPEDYIRVVREWGQAVWQTWSEYYAEVERVKSHHLKMD